MIAALLLTLAVPSSAGAADQELMKRWYGENELCRGSSDQATIDRECPKRDATGAELERRGWCWVYSDVNVPPPDYAWHRCDQARPAPEARIIRAPEHSFTPNPFEMWVLLPIILAVYLIPTIIAAFRRHRNLPAIAALNILAGWTFVGWVGSFVWSLLRDTSRA